MSWADLLRKSAEYARKSLEELAAALRPPGPPNQVPSYERAYSRCRNRRPFLRQLTPPNRLQSRWFSSSPCSDVMAPFFRRNFGRGEPLPTDWQPCRHFHRGFHPDRDSRWGFGPHGAPDSQNLRQFLLRGQLRFQVHFIRRKIRHMLRSKIRGPDLARRSAERSPHIGPFDNLGTVAALNQQLAQALHGRRRRSAHWESIDQDAASLETFFRNAFIRSAFSRGAHGRSSRWAGQNWGSHPWYDSVLRPSQLMREANMPCAQRQHTKPLGSMPWAAWPAEHPEELWSSHGAAFRFRKLDSLVSRDIWLDPRPPFYNSDVAVVDGLHEHMVLLHKRMAHSRSRRRRFCRNFIFLIRTKVRHLVSSRLRALRRVVRSVSLIKSSAICPMSSLLGLFRRQLPAVSHWLHDTKSDSRARYSLKEQMYLGLINDMRPVDLMKLANSHLAARQARRSPALSTRRETRNELSLLPTYQSAMNSVVNSDPALQISGRFASLVANNSHLLHAYHDFHSFTPDESPGESSYEEGPRLQSQGSLEQDMDPIVFSAAVDFNLAPRLTLPRVSELTDDTLASLRESIESEISRLQGVLVDITSLSELGELPLSVEENGTALRVHFPNSDTDRVNVLMDDKEVTWGNIVEIINPMIANDAGRSDIETISDFSSGISSHPDTSSINEVWTEVVSGMPDLTLNDSSASDEPEPSLITLE